MEAPHLNFLANKKLPASDPVQDHQRGALLSRPQQAVLSLSDTALYLCRYRLNRGSCYKHIPDSSIRPHQQHPWTDNSGTTDTADHAAAQVDLISVP